MGVLSVRLPTELEKELPRQERSAWVLQAIRERLRRERVVALAECAAEHAGEELEVVNEWSAASAPIPGEP